MKGEWTIGHVSKQGGQWQVLQWIVDPEPGFQAQGCWEQVGPYHDTEQEAEQAMMDLRDGNPLTLQAVMASELDRAINAHSELLDIAKRLVEYSNPRANKGAEYTATVQRLNTILTRLRGETL